ncbi:MAG: ABC transporter permease [Thermoplasmata archaeon]|nr:ABC transporter permease [Thermoplasmata archaeon]
MSGTVGTGPRSWGPGTVVAGLLSASLLALFLVPLVALVTFVPPSAIAQVASDPAARASIAFTLYASGLALLISLFLGIPLGYLLARRSFPGHALVESAVALPVVVPHLIAGIALFLIFEPGTFASHLAARLGFSVLETIWGVVLVMVYVSAPYTVLASQLAFRAVDPPLVESARSLGAPASRVFWSVSLPLAARGIAAGGLLTWARSVSEIGGFLILAATVYPTTVYSGPVTQPLSIYIYSFYQVGNLNAAVAASSLFVLVSFVIFVAVRFAERFGRLPWNRGEWLP